MAIIFHLTPNMPLIHTSFMYPKLNMDEIYGLKFYLLHVHIPEFFFEIPPCTKKVIFVTEFLILCKYPSFYEVNNKALRIEEFHFLF